MKTTRTERTNYCESAPAKTIEEIRDMIFSKPLAEFDEQELKEVLETVGRQLRTIKSLSFADAVKQVLTLYKVKLTDNICWDKLSKEMPRDLDGMVEDFLKIGIIITYGEKKPDYLMVADLQAVFEKIQELMNLSLMDESTIETRDSKGEIFARTLGELGFDYLNLNNWKDELLNDLPALEEYLEDNGIKLSISKREGMLCKKDLDFAIAKARNSLIPSFFAGFQKLKNSFPSGDNTTRKRGEFVPILDTQDDLYFVDEEPAPDRIPKKRPKMNRRSKIIVFSCVFAVFLTVVSVAMTMLYLHNSKTFKAIIPNTEIVVEIICSEAEFNDSGLTKIDQDTEPDVTLDCSSIFFNLKEMNWDNALGMQ